MRPNQTPGPGRRADEGQRLAARPGFATCRPSVLPASVAPCPRTMARVAKYVDARRPVGAWATPRSQGKHRDYSPGRVVGNQAGIRREVRPVRQVQQPHRVHSSRLRRAQQHRRRVATPVFETWVTDEAHLARDAVMCACRIAQHRFGRRRRPRAAACRRGFQAPCPRLPRSAAAGRACAGASAPRSPRSGAATPRTDCRLRAHCRRGIRRSDR